MVDEWDESVPHLIDPTLGPLPDRPWIPRQPCHFPNCGRYAEWAMGDPEDALKVGPSPEDARAAGMLTVVCPDHIGAGVVAYWAAFAEPVEVHPL